MIAKVNTLTKKITFTAGPYPNASGDDLVQKLDFVIDRFTGNGVDLGESDIYIYYTNGRGDTYSHPILSSSITRDDLFLRFRWDFAKEVSEVSGTTLFSICAKKESNGKYITEWNSEKASLPVIKSIGNREVKDFDSTAYQEIEGMLSESESKVNRKIAMFSTEITEKMAEFESDVDEKVYAAEQYKELSSNYRYLSESYAKGTMNGEPTPYGDAGYHDNSKYYKGFAEAYAKGTVDGTAVTPGQPGYQDNAKYYKEQVEASANQIAINTSRIDQIESLPGGSTSLDAEVVDIRVKADGRSATTAGNAVREQVTELRNLVTETTYDAILWAQGTPPASTSSSHIMTKDPVNGKYVGAVVPSGKYVLLYAKNGSTNLGYYRAANNTFVGSVVTATQYTEGSPIFEEIFAAYPTYTWYFVARFTAEGTISPSDGATVGLISNRIDELENDFDNSGLSGNLIPYDYHSGDTLTNNGIEFTKNADGSVSSSGTASGQARYYWVYEKEFPAGAYMLGGVPAGAGNREFGIQIALVANPAAADFTTYYTDTPITVLAGNKVSIRSWYYAGYVDAGHTWKIYFGSAFGGLDGRKNGNNFLPLLYESYQKTLQINPIIERLYNVENIVLGEPLTDSFELGSFTSGGKPTDSTNTVRTAGYLTKPSAEMPVKVEQGYRAYIHYYSTNTSIQNVATSGWINAGDSYTIPTTYNYYRYVVQKVPQADIPSADATEVGQKLYHDMSTQITRIVSGLAEESDVYANEINALESGYIDLAGYWKTYLDSISGSINSALYGLGNHGDSFLFFTDYHYDKNADKLGGEQLYKVLQYVTTFHAVTRIINGGDLLQTHDTVADALAELNIFYQHFHRFGNMYNVIGNHDSNHYNADARLTDGQMYQDLFAGFEIEKKAHLNREMYYYFDNETQKLRYMILNTRGNYSTFSADSDQMAWIVNTLANTPSGYGIVCIPHWFFEVNEEDSSVTQLSVFGTLIKTILDAYNNQGYGTWNGQAYDFTSATATVIAVITGHVHREYSQVSEAGYPMIGFICDAVNGSAQLTTRTLGTYSEHSVALVSVDTTNKTITCTPIGAGTTRTFSFS